MQIDPLPKAGTARSGKASNIRVKNESAKCPNHIPTLTIGFPWVASYKPSMANQNLVAHGVSTQICGVGNQRGERLFGASDTQMYKGEQETDLSYQRKGFRW